MSQWKNVDSLAGAPKCEIESDQSKTGTALYANVTPGAFVNNMVMGVFGIDKGEAVSIAAVTNPGWVLARWGTGPVATVVVAAGGTGYANTDTLKISGGQVNATGTLVTNATGGITTLTMTVLGSGFSNTTSAVVAVANSTGGVSAGTGASFTVKLGGRAGRKTVETLVAFKSMTANGSGGI